MDATCWYCTGEACAICYGRMRTAPCEHDSIDRHGEQPCRDMPET